MNANSTISNLAVLDIEDYTVPFRPQTEEQLLDKIDHSLAQIKSGQVWDAEDVEEKMLKGLDE